MKSLGSSAGLLAQGHNVLHNASSVRLQTLADVFLAVISLSILGMLIGLFQKRQALPLAWIVAGGGIFLATCGLSHALADWSLGLPGSWVSGGLKALSTTASLASGFLLLKMRPQFLAEPEVIGSVEADQSLERERFQRQLAEEKLVHSQRMLQSIVDHLPQRVFWKDANFVFLGCNAGFARDMGAESPATIVGKTDYDMPSKEHAPAFREDDALVLKTGLAKYHYPEPQERLDGSIAWLRTSKMPIRDHVGRICAVLGTYDDVTAIKTAEAALQESEERFRLAFEFSGIGMALISLEGRWLKVNRAVCEIVGYSETELHEKTFQDITHPEDLDADLDQVRRLVAGESRSYQMVKRYIHRNGEVVWIHLTASIVRDAGNSPLYFVSQIEDITERKRVEAEIEGMNRKLREVSRQAGMTEVATDVLHNVGNVLNSVNISCTVLAEKLGKLHIGSVGKAAQLLREHEDDLAGFFAQDPVGQKLPEFFGKLAERLSAEQAVMLHELQLLAQNIEHIKDIVARQQDYARVSGPAETIHIAELVEDSLRMNAVACSRDDVQLVRAYGEVPTLTVEKHKVLQILVNLIRNAQRACEDSGRLDKRMTLEVSHAEGAVRVAVIDNGAGIAPENLTRIFHHGFTTRKDGHGFGLHSAALAAREMGGRLTVQSEGVGAGAVFVLELPIQRATNGAEPGSPGNYWEV